MMNPHEYTLETLAHDASHSGITRLEFVKRTLALGISVPAAVMALAGPVAAHAGRNSAAQSPGPAMDSSIAGAPLPGVQLVPRVAWGS